LGAKKHLAADLGKVPAPPLELSHARYLDIRERGYDEGQEDSSAEPDFPDLTFFRGTDGTKKMPVSGACLQIRNTAPKTRVTQKGTKKKRVWENI